MDSKMYITLVDEHGLKLHCEEFVLGQISGIGYVISGSKRGLSITHIDNAYLYAKEFEPVQYERFKLAMDDLYPGLCEYDIQIKESE